MIAEDVDFDFDLGDDDDGDADEAFSVDGDDYGYDFGGLVGYDFGPFRMEAEASYREIDVDGVNAGGPNVRTSFNRRQSGNFDAAGDINALSFMVNGLVDFGPDDGLQGYAGGGVGVARTEFQATVDRRDSGIADDSDTGFAWQVLAGVRAPLTRTIDAGLRYRLFTAESVGVIDNDGIGLDGRLRSHSLLGTLTFNFGWRRRARLRGAPGCGTRARTRGTASGTSARRASGL